MNSRHTVHPVKRMNNIQHTNKPLHRIAKRTTHKKSQLPLFTLGCLIVLQAVNAYALPQGEQLQTNNATFDRTQQQLTIKGNHSKANVAINWDSFSIAKGETVNFQQMNAVLNNVTGSQASQIDGNLNGENVKVFLVNPNGITVSKEASINVGTLHLSTRQLDKDTLKNFNGELTVLTPEQGKTLTKDVVNLGQLKADSLIVEGNRVILGTDTLKGVKEVTSEDKNVTIPEGKVKVITHDLSHKVLIAIGGHEDIQEREGEMKNQNLIIHQAVDEQDDLVSIGKISADGDERSMRAKDYASVETQLTFTGINLNNDSSQTIQASFPVDTLYDLQNINANLTANYYLTTDIKAEETKNWHFSLERKSNEGFMPIGSESSPFKGTFDGTGHKISGLMINRDRDYVGLFGNIDRRTITNPFGYDFENAHQILLRNITLEGLSIKGNSIVGGLAGKVSYGQISHVDTTGDIYGYGDSSVGGIIGQMYGGYISNVSYHGNVMAHNGRNVGGVNGFLDYGSINNAEVIGDVSGNSSVGGIVGTGSRILVNNAHKIGNVYGDDEYVGGIAAGAGGDLFKIDILHSYVIGDIKGTYGVGGLVGDGQFGTIDDSYVIGNVTGVGGVGGLAGLQYKVLNSYFQGKVIGKEIYVGGLVGQGFIVNNAYVEGNIENAGNYTGGIMGNLLNSPRDSNTYGHITNTYIKGDVKGVQNVGGLIGKIDDNGDGVEIKYTYIIGKVEDASGVINNFVAEIGNGTTITDSFKESSDGDVIGFRAWDDNSSTPMTLTQFNAKFQEVVNAGGDEVSANWKIYKDGVTPLLTYWLKPITVTTDRINYTGNNLTAADLHYDIEQPDLSKILFNQTIKNASSNSYNLADILYSVQQGYNITANSLFIDKAPLVISANQVTINKGEPLPALSGSVTGLLGNDSVSLFGSTLFNAPTADIYQVGDYPIWGTFGNNDWMNNYYLVQAPSNATALHIKAVEVEPIEPVTVQPEPNPVIKPISQQMIEQWRSTVNYMQCVNQKMHHQSPWETLLCKPDPVEYPAQQPTIRVHQPAVLTEL
ncbi:filamentous hemagglutinin N-terminal domain-containing protein [Gallibacterium melopsittaci]|uniref:Filamentous hemagglutinin N-terminal domain-containing protein n=1 Tax=Gallibacterium melopsittaci TaxID=516063 RepID=A0ABV6HWW3_9PAST